MTLSAPNACLGAGCCGGGRLADAGVTASARPAPGPGEGPAPDAGGLEWQQRWQELLAAAKAAGSQRAGGVAAPGGCPTGGSLAGRTQLPGHTLLLRDLPPLLGVAPASPQPSGSPTMLGDVGDSSSGSYAFAGAPASGAPAGHSAAALAAAAHGAHAHARVAHTAPAGNALTDDALLSVLAGADGFSALDSLASGYFGVAPRAPGGAAPAGAAGRRAAGLHGAAGLLGGSITGDQLALAHLAAEQHAHAQHAAALQAHAAQQAAALQQSFALSAPLPSIEDVPFGLAAAGGAAYGARAGSVASVASAASIALSMGSACGGSGSGGGSAGGPLAGSAGAQGPSYYIPKSSSLYVKNLPPEADKCYLYERFAPYGAVMSVKILTDAGINTCRGVGFVNFANHDDAVRAAQALHGTKVGDKLLHVSLQTPRLRAAMF